MNGGRAAPTSVKVFAVLMALYGFFVLKSAIYDVDLKRSTGILQMVIAVIWAICMIVAANGLWKAERWGLKMYWVTTALMLLQIIVAVVEDALTGSESMSILLTLLFVFGVFFGLLGLALRGSLERQRS